MTPPTPPRHLYGILGMPLGHSMSPALHSWLFSLCDHAGAYFAWEKTAEDLPAFMQAVRALPIAGMSVTIPHKQAVAPYLDGLTEHAKAVGAVNTLFWQDGKLLGDNTDVTGFVYPLQTFATGTFAGALILGAGGVCRAALAGLASLGITDVVVAARSVQKAAPLAQAFGCGLVSWEDRLDVFARMAAGSCLIINATPLGMHGKHQPDSPVPAASWQVHAAPESIRAAYDLVYNPLETCFLSDARAAGWQAQDGLDLFVAQGLAQCTRWTGHVPPFAQSREFVAQLLLARQGRRI